jgi:hypothetical protein
MKKLFQKFIVYDTSTHPTRDSEKLQTLVSTAASGTIWRYISHGLFFTPVEKSQYIELFHKKCLNYLLIRCFTVHWTIPLK